MVAKKRWLAAALVSLALAYPASVGPATYAEWRGRISRPVFRAVYAPVLAVAGIEHPWNPVRAYVGWWDALCVRLKRKDTLRDDERAQRETLRPAVERGAAREAERRAD